MSFLPRWDQVLRVELAQSVINAVQTEAKTAVRVTMSAAIAKSGRTQRPQTENGFVHECGGAGGAALVKQYGRLKLLANPEELGTITPGMYGAIKQILSRISNTYTKADIERRCNAYKMASGIEDAVASCNADAENLRKELAQRDITAKHLHDLDCMDELLADLIFRELGSGNHPTVRRNFRMIFVPLRQRVGEFKSQQDVWLRQVEWVLSAGLSSFFRMGDDYHYALAGQMERLLCENKSPTLRARYMAYKHTQDVTSAFGAEAVQLLQEQGKKPNDARFARIYSFGAENAMHCGRDLSDPLPTAAKYTLESAIREASEAENKAGNLDAAMRYRTNIVRCHLLNRRIEAAAGEIDSIRMEVRRSGLALPHVDLRLLLDESVMDYLHARRSDDSFGEQRAIMRLGEANDASKRLKAPLMWDSHRREYSKLMPPIALLY